MSVQHYEYYDDRESGLRIAFRTDRDAPELLHIWARHTTTVEDAITCVLEGTTTFNFNRRRFDSVNQTHLVTWLIGTRQIIVLTCIRREDGE